jgi:hypothetical protein
LIQERVGNTLELVGIGRNFLNETPAAQQLRDSKSLLLVRVLELSPEQSHISTVLCMMPEGQVVDLWKTLNLKVIIL